MARGKDNRGGARQGTSGVNYTNRSDMRTTQPIKTVSTGEYGATKAQEDAQRAIPLQNAAGVQNQQAQQQARYAGELGSFDRPTDRPSEPLTAGVPMGAGPGPDNALSTQINDVTKARMRAIYLKYPNEGMRMLLEQMDNG